MLTQLYLCTFALALDSAFKTALKSPMATIGYLSKAISEDSRSE